MQVGKPKAMWNKTWLDMEQEKKEERSFDSRNKRTFHSRINAQIEGFIWPQKPLKSGALLMIKKAKKHAPNKATENDYLSSQARSTNFVWDFWGSFETPCET